MAIYENVKHACEKSGTTVFALEQKLNFPRSSIYKWNTNIPSVAKVKMVADELKVSVDSLLKED